MTSVTFWFDPACYWSWRTARWLRDAAEQRDVTVDWRPFSLKVLYGDDMNPDWRSMLDTAHQALRVVQALHAKGRSEDLAAFYFALGTAVHEEGKDMSVETVRAAAAAGGATDTLDALDDESWDAPIRTAFDEAMATAGPDIGSPVLLIEGSERGIHGPVFASVPPSGEAGELFDAVVRLSRAPYFFELKRGRR